MQFAVSSYSFFVTQCYWHFFKQTAIDGLSLLWRGVVEQKQKNIKITCDTNAVRHGVFFQALGRAVRVWKKIARKALHKNFYEIVSSVMICCPFSISLLLLLASFQGLGHQISMNLAFVAFFSFWWFLIFAFFDFVLVFDRFWGPFEHVVASKFN